MNVRRIVVPTDYSESNRAALHYASTLAAEAGATLHIVHVHDPYELNNTMRNMSYMSAAEWEQEQEEARARDRKNLDGVVPTVPGVACQHHCPVGRSDDEIVALAVDKGADLIVMDSHGRTGLSRLLMGSVAESVMRRAPCPVLIVKQPTKEETPVNQRGAIAAPD